MALHAMVACHACLAPSATVASAAAMAVCTIAPHSIETAIPVTLMIGEIHVQIL